MADGIFTFNPPSPPPPSFFLICWPFEKLQSWNRVGWRWGDEISTRDCPPLALWSWATGRLPQGLARLLFVSPSAGCIDRINHLPPDLAAVTRHVLRLQERAVKRATWSSHCVIITVAAFCVVSATLPWFSLSALAASLARNLCGGRGGWGRRQAALGVVRMRVRLRRTARKLR